MSRVRLWFALALGLLDLVAPKRTCSPSAPCDASCKAERSHKHCKYCKCRACAMCTRSGGMGSKRSRKSRPAQRPLQRLGRSRQWTPAAELTVRTNRSAAAVLLRMMGYVPGAQIPLEFGGPGEDFELEPTRHVALARAEATAAGPKVVPFHLQKAAAAHGSAPASWLSSPVAQLLARERARPPYRRMLEPGTMQPHAQLHSRNPTCAGRRGPVRRRGCRRSCASRFRQNNKVALHVTRWPCSRVCAICPCIGGRDYRRPRTFVQPIQN